MKRFWKMLPDVLTWIAYLDVALAIAATAMGSSELALLFVMSSLCLVVAAMCHGIVEETRNGGE